MSHSHVLYDSDPHFKIESISRNIINESSSKVALIQHDHNSERFTFEIPRYIEGHDLQLCNLVEVHFLNIEYGTKKTIQGVYTVKDLQVKTDNEDFVVCSWVVSNNATQLVGQLSFLLRFSCILDDGTVNYVWNTGIYNGISISSGIDSNGAVEDYTDILNEWRQELKSNQVVSLVQTKTSTADNGENVWTATFGDGRTQVLKVRNGSQGPKGETGLVGSIETINKTPLHFFTGTKEEYKALPIEQKVNLFALLTDTQPNGEVINAFETNGITKPGLYLIKFKAPTNLRYSKSVLLPITDLEETTAADKVVFANMGDSAEMCCYTVIYEYVPSSRKLEVRTSTWIGNPSLSNMISTLECRLLTEF